MKKVLLLMLMVVAVFGGTDEDVINSVGSGASTAASIGGLAFVHATAWLPIIIFIALAALVVGFYFNKFEQKDRGLWKTVGAVFVSVIVGYLGHYATYKALDGIWGDGCSSRIAGAYFKDAAAKGLNPSSQFGTNIQTVMSSCNANTQ